MTDDGRGSQGSAGRTDGDGHSHDLHVLVEPAGDATVLAVSGDLDVFSLPDMRAALFDQFSHGPVRLVVDLTEVTFVDSTGVGLLAGTRRRALVGDGWLRVVATSEHVLHSFALTGLSDVIPVFPTRHEALTSHSPDLETY